jgi:cytochrome c-type biogenesis protein CcmF
MGAQGAGPVRSFFEGEATSEVGRRTTVGGDFWTAMQPDLGPLDAIINGADRRLGRIARGVRPGDVQAERQLSYLQGLAIRSIRERYLRDPPPANFRVNVNPLVTWIWIGWMIALIGALVALWPSAGARGRVREMYAARLARELSRA